MNAETWMERNHTYAEGEMILHGKLHNPTGRWGLFYGIHRGTLMSRDADGVDYRYASFAECKAALAEAAAHFARLGYSIWFAQAVAPDGTQHKLVNGAPYR